jgi:hypothetical protein
MSDSLLQRIIQAPEAFFASQGGQSFGDVRRDAVAGQGGAHGRADLAEADGLFLGENLQLGLEREDIPAGEQFQPVAQAGDAFARFAGQQGRPFS